MANLSKPLNQGFAAPSIVANYGPYASIAAAHAALTDDGLNVIGMTVGITGADNTIVEYWYQGGTAQTNLVEKQQGGGGEQVQADWTQEDSTQPDYIKNKPASAISGRIWIDAGNSKEDIIKDGSLHLNYVYGTPLQITADNNKLILVYTINVELPLKMYVGGVEIPYDKSTGTSYHVLMSKNNYTGTVEVVVKQ